MKKMFEKETTNNFGHNVMWTATLSLWCSLFRNSQEDGGENGWINRGCKWLTFLSNGVNLLERQMEGEVGDLCAIRDYGIGDCIRVHWKLVLEECKLWFGYCEYLSIRNVNAKNMVICVVGAWCILHHHILTRECYKQCYLTFSWH